MPDDLGRLVAKHASTGVIIDTNVLLLLFVGRLDRRLLGDHGFKRTRTFSQDGFDLLERFVRDFARVLVTPHILAEVNSLGNQLREPARWGFYRLMAETLPKVEERYHESRTFGSVGEQVFPRIGLTDSLTILAAGTSCLVLTDDVELYNQLACRSCDVVNFNHLRRVE